MVLLFIVCWWFSAFFLLLAVNEIFNCLLVIGYLNGYLFIFYIFVYNFSDFCKPYVCKGDKVEYKFVIKWEANEMAKHYWKCEIVYKSKVANTY